MKRIGLVCLAAACGSSSSKQPDAAVHVDARADAPADATPDVAVDAPVDVPEGVSGHYHYVVNRLVWPTTSNEARADGLDLDGNGTIDNQLGMVLSSLTAQGFDVQTPTDQSLARGGSITLADLAAPDLTNATGATFTLFAGTNPSPTPCNNSADTVCGHHLTGTGTFDVAAMPRDTPIAGAIASTVFTGGPGHLSIPLYVMTGSPTIITLLGARAKLTPKTGGVMTGIIAGAVSTADINSKIYPAMQQSFSAAVAQDCSMLANPPTCGCTQGSTGATMISLFDTNQDCAITLTEVKNNSLIMALFAPDVTVENQSALSVGFAFTAVDAAFTP